VPVVGLAILKIVSMAAMIQTAVGLLFMAATVDAAVLTAEQKTAVVDKHNALRAAVSKPCTATDMETMVWDDTLAAAAVTWAEACVGDHDPKAAIDFGENLWMSFGGAGTTYATSDFPKATQSWYDEIGDVDWIKDSNGVYTEAKSKVYSAGGKVCSSADTANGICYIGHFTQVVWAKSNKIGCGISTCSALTQSSTAMGAGVLMVCRYLVPGNSAASKAAGHLKMPYIAGTACAGCSGSCTTAGLCNAGTTPTRCTDKFPTSFGGAKVTSCADYDTKIKKQFSDAGLTWTSLGGGSTCTNKNTKAMYETKGVHTECLLTCGKCSVPSGVGVCTGGTGGATKVSGGNTTSGTTTGGTTSGTTVTEYKFTGTISMVVPNVTKTQMETASKNSLASHFDISADRVTANATESRRLSTNRRLAGNWAIAYEFKAPAAKKAAVSAKVKTASSDTATFKATFTTAFKTAIQATGASVNVSAIQVSSFTAAEGVPAGTSAGGATTRAAGTTAASILHAVPPAALLIIIMVHQLGLA